MPIRYVKPFTARLVDDDRKPITQLLWGDPVHTTGSPVDGYYKARARARPVDRATGRRAWGWVKADDLMPTSALLELYVIDVGQGDSVLVRTPDGAWHLVDGGVRAEEQMTKKGCANFVRWKFLDDLARERVELKTVVLSHPDADHYGGLIDLLEGKVPLRATPFEVRVERFYHSGIANFAAAPKIGARVQGRVPAPPIGGYGIRATDSFITELLDDQASFRTPARPFARGRRQGTGYDRLAELVGAVPGEVRRLSRADGFLPGYGPNDDGGAVIHVLGPVTERLESGEEGLRVLGDDGETKNGHSVVLRIDYGQARLLLTGDLNAESQRFLLSHLPASEFAADVAKACHHGAEAIEMDFVRAMQARATVISSGDNESHAHPRPVLMGASGRYGRDIVTDRGAAMPPLLYSTELARSVALCYANAARLRQGTTEPAVWQALALKGMQVRPGTSTASFRSFATLPVSENLVYGLVNVRTDGEHILCATMEEAGSSFTVKVFKAGTAPA